MPEGPSPSWRTQRSCVLHSLCGVLKCANWPDWEEPQAVCQWIPQCPEEWGHSSICHGRVCVQDWTCSGPQAVQGVRPLPSYHHTLHVGKLVHPAWTGSGEPYWKCTWSSWTDEHIPIYHLVFLTVHWFCKYSELHDSTLVYTGSWWVYVYR